jgi:hypothetical protein
MTLRPMAKRTTSSGTDRTRPPNSGSPSAIRQKDVKLSLAHPVVHIECDEH